jgi:hypothetical protein
MRVDYATLDLRQFARGLNSDCAVGIGLEAHSCRSELVQHLRWMRRGYLGVDSVFKDLPILLLGGLAVIDAPLSRLRHPVLALAIFEALDVPSVTCLKTRARFHGRMLVTFLALSV